MAARLTSAQVIATHTADEMIGIINEIAGMIPELSLLVASPVPEISYKTLVCTGLPTAGFRAINVGRDRSEGVYVLRDVDCKYLDGSWDIDNAAVKGIKGNKFVPQLQRDHLLAAMKAWQRQIYDGVGADAGGFPGLASLFPYSDSDGVVDAGGSSAGTGSSIYLVKTGEQEVCVPWGHDGEITVGELKTDVQLYDGDSKPFMGQTQAIEGYAGLQLTNHKAVMRIGNLTAEDGHTATDSLISGAVIDFAARYGVMPDLIAMSYRSLKQLQDSKTAVNATGAEAPIPESVQKVRVVPTLGITNTETILTATPSGSE